MTLKLPNALTFGSQLLEECINISEALPPVEGIGHSARANYKLSQILKDLGNDQESAKYIERAILLRNEMKGLDGESITVNGVPSDFEGLVPWMLW